jgi:hypothetical protein
MTKLHALLLAILVCSMPTSGCIGPGSTLRPESQCIQEGRARPICLFQNPEDLAPLPKGDALIASEYAAPDGSRPGRLSLFLLETEEHRVLYTGGDAGDEKPAWGADDCPGPPPLNFSPHGIHVSERADGALQLLVVQHAGRESVEFFEVRGAGIDRSLAWRGCAVAPARAWLNAVAAVPGGGFVTTSMMERLETDADQSAALHAPISSGYVATWSATEGFGRLPGSEGARPNGIEVSHDGRYVFLNSSGEDQVQRILRATGEVEATAEIIGLDNARWASDGRLIVASIETENDEIFSTCMELMSHGQGTCPIPFRIIAIDPVTMAAELLYQSDGSPMGGGTVGVVLDDELFVGSFSGDRILRITLEQE